MTILVYIVVCFNLFLNANEAARILAVFPVTSISHQVVFRPLTQELARRGHEVTVITPDPAYKNGGAPPNLTEIDVHDISYNLWRDKFITNFKYTETDFIGQMDVILQSMVLLVEAQLNDEKVQSLINDKSKKFDLLMLEACARPNIVYSHIYKKVPVILVSSFFATFDNYVNIGVPVHPILYPVLTRQRLHNLSVWEKVTEVYNDYKLQKLFYQKSDPEENAMLRRIFGPEIPPIEELNKNVDMLFVNVHPVFEGIRPVPPNVVFMGGLHQKPSKELPSELKSYLDNSKNGVIYVSFGTNVDPSALPADKIQALVNVFSELPYDVLWKWNKDELPGRTSNIRISKWLPQSDLLKHPKIKLFITQGGLQSTDEAITAAVPLIGIPMLGDQWYNVEQYVFHKIGIRMDLQTLTEEKLKNSINAVIGDDSYRQNIIKLRSIMNDEPLRPLERAVWWTEHVLRHGGAKHLRSPGANISWAQYLELELVLTLLLGLLTFIVVLIMIIRFLYKLVAGKNVSKAKFKRC